MNPKKQDLVTVGQAGQLYRKMHDAIVTCHTIDDCVGIREQATAIAAYFKQIKDDESLHKFLAIKLRAWRRIGELLIGRVDTSKCDTQYRRVLKIKAELKGDSTIDEMSDSNITTALKLGEMPADFFEREVGSHVSPSALLQAYHALLREQWEATPEGQLEVKRLTEQEKQHAILQAKADRDRQKQYDQQRAKAEQDRIDLAALQAAREAADEEVGFTMDRRDRDNMKEVVFLIKATIHATMRQAAFDRHITMQAILRAGLAMWLIAHGYTENLDDLKPPTPKGRHDERRGHTGREGHGHEARR